MECSLSVFLSLLKFIHISGSTICLPWTLKLSISLFLVPLVVFVSTTYLGLWWLYRRVSFLKSDCELSEGWVMSPIFLMSSQGITLFLTFRTFSHIHCLLSRAWPTQWWKRSCSVVSDSLRPHGEYSPPGSSVHGVFQARILESVAISFSRTSSWPSDWTCVSCIIGRHFTIWATRIQL